MSIYLNYFKNLNLNTFTPYSSIRNKMKTGDFSITHLNLFCVITTLSTKGI